jgi:hypothetical protein
MAIAAGLQKPLARVSVGGHRTHRQKKPLTAICGRRFVVAAASLATQRRWRSRATGKTQWADICVGRRKRVGLQYCDPRTKAMLQILTMALSGGTIKTAARTGRFEGVDQWK